MPTILNQADAIFGTPTPPRAHDIGVNAPLDVLSPRPDRLWLLDDRPSQVDRTVNCGQCQHEHRRGERRAERIEAVRLSE